MTSYETIKADVLDPMRMLFAPPRGCENPDMALGQYVRPLQGFPATVLKAGWERVVETYELTSWPKPAVIVKACREVHDRHAGPSRVPKPDDKPDNIEAAHAAMRGPLGQRALSEGWGRILFDFVRDHGPDEPVPTDRLMRLDADTRRTVAGLSEGDQVGTLSLRALGQKLLRREQALQQRYLQP